MDTHLWFSTTISIVIEYYNFFTSLSVMSYNMFRVPHALANVHSLDVPELFLFSFFWDAFFFTMIFSCNSFAVFYIVFRHTFFRQFFTVFLIIFLLRSIFPLYRNCTMFPMCSGIQFVVLHPPVHISLYLLLFHSNHLYLLCILIHILFISSVCYKSIY